MGTYAIADIHGRFDLLCEALDLIEGDADGKPASLIIMGDFVDRGPQSREIIELLMEGPRLPGWRWVVLQGNHEVMMLHCLSSPRSLGWWTGNGGGATLRSYGYRQGDLLEPLKVSFTHLSWLANLPVTYEDGLRIFVHAGVPFDKAVSKAKRQTLQWMLYPGDVAGADADTYPDRPHCSGKHIVHGHHQDPAHPLLKPHRTNLDSFAWATGRLAIGVFDETQGAPIRILEALGEPGMVLDRVA